MYSQFGQVLPAAMIATSIANVGVTAYHAVKVSKLQRGFTEKLDSDEQKKEYIKYIIQRLQSLGTRLAKGGRYRPGTKAFELVLKKALLDDMNYKGYCNANIFVPHTMSDTVNTARKIYASINRGGYVSSGAVPPDVGPIWATGCKNAEDYFRMAYIDMLKAKRKHGKTVTHREDIGSMDLFLRFGTGLLLLMVMMATIKIQKAVVIKQEPSKK